MARRLFVKANTSQQRSDEAAIETLYRQGWQYEYRRAMADVLYMAAWVEDRARYGLRNAAEWTEQEFMLLVLGGERAKAVEAVNEAVRDRQPRPRRTVVDDRLAYYDDLLR